HGTRAVYAVIDHGDRLDAVVLGQAQADDVVAVHQDHRAVGPLRVTPYSIPEGCCAGYYPECNALLPVWHHAERSKVPAAKSIPVRLRKMIAAAVAGDVPRQPSRPQRSEQP
ncbi:formate dehydrogenase, partial [Stutzerimonas stutzeri]|nr:formate dehydrogenase [Stutzerimonas stutzeri]